MVLPRISLKSRRRNPLSDVGIVRPPRLPRRAQEFARLRRLGAGCVELFTRPFLEKQPIISFKFRFAEGEVARYILKGLSVTNSRAYVTGEASCATDCVHYHLQCLVPQRSQKSNKMRVKPNKVSRDPRFATEFSLQFPRGVFEIIFRVAIICLSN